MIRRELQFRKKWRYIYPWVHGGGIEAMLIDIGEKLCNPYLSASQRKEIVTTIEKFLTVRAKEMGLTMTDDDFSTNNAAPSAAAPAPNYADHGLDYLNTGQVYKVLHVPILKDKAASAIEAIAIIGQELDLSLDDMRAMVATLNEKFPPKQMINQIVHIPLHTPPDEINGSVHSHRPGSLTKERNW